MADSILRLTRVPAAGYELWLSRVPVAGCKLQLIPSCGWLKFWRLDTSCGWLRPTADMSSGGWIRVAAVLSSSGRIKVTADSILRLTRVPAAGDNLRLIPSCGWLEFGRLDTSCSWSHPAAGYELWLTRVLPAGLDLRLFYTLIYLSSKFKDLFCKIHHSYGLFFTAWFQLPLIQALPAASRTLKKHEEVSRLYLRLILAAAADSMLIRDLRPIDYLQNFDLDAPWYWVSYKRALREYLHT